MADEELRRIFAHKLNYYLLKNGYTQADMSRRMNVSTATTAKWCTGQTIPRVDKIQTLAVWLGVTKADLMGENASNNEYPDYYLNPDARDLAQFLFKNPEYKVLFDASRNIKKEDIQFVKEMIDRITGN